jgi:N-acyl homoserine lactone hydrolase
MTLEVRRLYLGSVDGPFGRGTPLHGYAIKHPQGVVLVDTGLGDPGDAPWTREYNVRVRMMDVALADHGLSIVDVKYIITTHLDHDHMGQNFLFKDASFVVQRAELEHARSESTPEIRELFDFPGVRFEILEGDAEVLPGITALSTPGHTPGHQSVLLDGGGGGERQLIVGDAAYTAAVYAHPEEFGEDHPGWVLQVRAGRETWVQSLSKLRALNADVVHFCHDNRIVGRDDRPQI